MKIIVWIMGQHLSISETCNPSLVYTRFRINASILDET